MKIFVIAFFLSIVGHAQEPLSCGDVHAGDSIVIAGKTPVLDHIKNYVFEAKPTGFLRRIFLSDDGTKLFGLKAHPITADTQAVVVQSGHLTTDVAGGQAEVSCDVKVHIKDAANKDGIDLWVRQTAWGWDGKPVRASLEAKASALVNFKIPAVDAPSVASAPVTSANEASR